MTAPILPSGRRPNTPAGLYYNGETKDFALDAYGQIRSVHPVDEAMAMSLFVDKGSSKACPTIGNELRKIQYLGSITLADEVQAKVLSAQPLAQLVSDGKVKITSIITETDGNRLCVKVYYVNLLTADARELTSHEQKLTWYS